MARGKHTREEIRNLAIDVAEQCIVEHGMQGMNARHIAKEMGYAVGTLYQVFKSMDLLIFEVNMRSLLALEKHLRDAAQAEAVQDGTHCHRAIEAMVMRYVDYALQETNRWQTLFEHRLPNDVALPEIYQKHRSQLFRLLEEQLKCAYPDKSNRDIGLEARALWAGVHGICTLALLNKLDDDGLNIKAIVQTLLVRFNTVGGDV